MSNPYDDAPSSPQPLLTSKAQILAVEGASVKIGTDSGDVITVPLATLRFPNPTVGQKVNVHRDGESYIVSPAGPVTGSGGKSKLAAGLLAIFLGVFGVGNFYLGFTGRAIAQLLITVLSFGFLFWISAIWGLIEGIVILTSKPGSSAHRDASGAELED